MQKKYKAVQPQKYQRYTLVIHHFSVKQKVDIKVQKKPNQNKTKEQLTEWAPAERSTETNTTHVSYN